MSGLFAELKRRNVIRVAAAYLVAAWLFTEVASVILPVFGAPDWVLKVVIAFLIVGFPLALVFSWVYEMTPDGLKREIEVERTDSITHQTGRRLDLMTMGLIVVAIGFIVFERTIWKPQAETTSTPPVVEQESVQAAPEPSPPTDDRQSIAVLPFVNMSDDPANEYFSDGISEELLNVLVKVRELRVPSRTSSFTFKGSDLRLSEIASELDVRHILEGSVRKAGNQVRVTAQLIDAQTDAHIWSDTYTRSLDDIFAIQDEIANAIVDSLKIALTGESVVSGHATDNAEAYNHYLKARHLWHGRTASAFQIAERELRQAVEIDPDYADAWAALADIYVLSPEYGFLSVADGTEKARAALKHALAINAESARALTARAYLRALFEFDFAGAESDYQTAIRLDPNYATAFQWYGELLALQRRFEEAEVHIRRSIELDPLAPVRHMVLGNTFTMQGRFDQAMKQYRDTLEVRPDWFNVFGNLAAVHLFQQRFEEAVEYARRYEAALRHVGVEGYDADYIVAAIEAAAGRIPVEEAVAAIRNSPSGFCNATDKSAWMAAIGAFDAAMDMIDECFEKGDPYAIYINAAYPYRAMHDIPRFQQQLARVGFKPEGSPP